MEGLSIEVYSYKAKIRRDAGTHGSNCLRLAGQIFCFLNFSNTILCFILGIIGNLKK